MDYDLVPKLLDQVFVSIFLQKDIFLLLGYNCDIIIPQKELMAMPKIIPIRDLKKTSEISQMCKEATEPIYITKNGYGDMVIMSIKMYEEKLSMLDVYEKLTEAEVQIAEGKVLDGETSLRSIREKYNV
jgi:PHD/YefM family antitoxin component YafN of YafNO toxin-antitoxin module